MAVVAAGIIKLLRQDLKAPASAVNGLAQRPLDCVLVERL
jgi:hypothetical protein